MAIAYYIPDQRKLLLGQYGGGGAVRNHNNNNNNCSSHNRNTSATPGNSQSRTTTTTATVTTTTPPVNYNNTTNFRANITIPLTAFPAAQHHRQQNSSTHNVGCWDLLTQVFCYAFRFYHESNHRSGGVRETNTTSTSAATVIQITVEISNGGVGTETMSSTDDAASTEQPLPQSRARDKN